jgi:hypothetical protein
MGSRRMRSRFVTPVLHACAVALEATFAVHACIAPEAGSALRRPVSKIRRRRGRQARCARMARGGLAPALMAELWLAPLAYFLRAALIIRR